LSAAALNASHNLTRPAISACSRSASSFSKAPEIERPRLSQIRSALTRDAGRGRALHAEAEGGPTLSFVIGGFLAPTTCSDICRMPLARMKTLHTPEPAGPGTVMRVRITITGPLAWFWGRVMGRKHAAGLPAQTGRILAAARSGLRASA
jgi:hypothetical protein